MDDFQILKLLDRFKGLFLKAGIEYDLMRKILQVKLLMDARRVPTLYQNAKKPKKEGNYFFRSLWVYVVMSIIVIPLVIMGKNYTFQMTIAFALIMFVLMTSMVADFSTVLLDIRDRKILTSKPIKKKTVSAAKTIHICIYMFYITMAISALPIIAGTISHGLVFLGIFLIELLLTNLMMVVLTALFYFFILRFFDGERLKDIINYVQIGLSIVSVIGYQFVGRAFDLVNMNMVLNVKWWDFFLPPMWYAAPFDMVLNGNVSKSNIMFSALAIVVPILAMIIYANLMPAFEKNLQKLAEEGGQRQKPRRRWSRWLAHLFCFSKEERTFFEFASLMMKKERDFKLKVYPTLGFSLILPFIFVFNMLRDQPIANIRLGSGYLSIYGSLLMIPTVIMMLNYSGKFKGAWVFKAGPLKDPSPLFKGTLKAFFIKLFLPVYLVLCIIYILIFGLRVVPSLFVVFTSAILYALVCFKSLRKSLPFSEPMEEINNRSGMGIIPFLLINGIFLGAHTAFIHFHWNLGIYFIVLILFTFVLWQKTMNTRWGT